MSFKIEVKGKDKVYSANFRSLTIDDYDEALSMAKKSKSDLDSLNVDISFARRLFKDGDKELIDVHNHLDLFMSYRNQLYKLFEIKLSYIDTLEDGTKEVTVIDCDLDEFDGELKYNKTKKTVKIGKKTYKYYKAIFKTPNYEELKYYLIANESGRSLSALQELARNCYIKGDEEVYKNPQFMYSASTYFQSLLDIYDSSIKKK